jgi:hypothetical protein
MVSSWALSILDAIITLAQRLRFSRFLQDVESWEPKAWLTLIAAIVAFWAFISFLRSTRRQAGGTRRRSHSDMIWERRDGD